MRCCIAIFCLTAIRASTIWVGRVMVGGGGVWRSKADMCCLHLSCTMAFLQVAINLVMW